MFQFKKKWSQTTFNGLAVLMVWLESWNSKNKNQTNLQISEINSDDENKMYSWGDVLKPVIRSLGAALSSMSLYAMFARLSRNKARWCIFIPVMLSSPRVLLHHSSCSISGFWIVVDTVFGSVLFPQLGLCAVAVYRSILTRYTIKTLHPS